MGRELGGTIEVDVYFFKHILECLDRQKKISLQPLYKQADWQARIDITIDQVGRMIEEAEIQHRLNCALSHQYLMEFDEDESNSNENVYSEE